MRGGSLESIGQRLEKRLIEELDVEPLPQFSDLLDLRNLRDTSTGYVKVFGGNRITKASSLSITMGPAGRYFNIHIIPDHHYDAPRFVFEGMLTRRGSQLSTDLLPDRDFVANFEALERQYRGVAKLYDRARRDTSLHIEASRQTHMRCFCSPFFLCVFDATEDVVLAIEHYAGAYFDEWLKIIRRAGKHTEHDSKARLERREYISNTIIAKDPDRDKVVQVYGEETTSAIERATML